MILFGSRARGDATQESDWDLLVIVNEDISFDELKKLTADIQLRLAALSIPNDVTIRGIKQFEASKTIVGNISYFADKEDIKI
ncbi:MAG: nucleotidyltransferase domain-containing protein [Candidatus Atribacteria bacterium]|nr:nucleotidyltransferase domain-containing protein [Candidatus Atribacteria bacterium]